MVPSRFILFSQVLVTGGAGYIGSHTVLELLDAGYEVTVMDNLYNASTEGLKRVEKLTGKAPKFEQVDMLDIPGMDALFAKEKFDAVIHFAGLKAVGESVAKPLFCTPPPTLPASLCGEGWRLQTRARRSLQTTGITSPAPSTYST